MSCPSDNQQEIDQSGFFSSDGVNWDAHKIGWVIAGACAAATVAISLVSVLKHATHYTCRGEQRQILRILYMPPIYAVISFLSYRYFRSYTYYDLVETIYEASHTFATPVPYIDISRLYQSITLSAFLLLLIEYVAATASEHKVHNAIARKEKQTLPVPFCCWRFRPTKAYFMYTVKWSVLQYVIIRPVLSIVGIICQRKGILCESGAWSFHTAKAYITVIDGISITIALYGLLLFYGLTKDELKGRRPLAKFLAIKLIVMFTFYQSLVFGALEGRVIHATRYWTETNIADGLNALCICVEMVIFSAFMMWAYSWNEYKIDGQPRTSIWRPLWDSINYSDFFVEIWGSIKFFWDYFRGKPHARATIIGTDGKSHPKMNLEEAFGVEGARTYTQNSSASSGESAIGTRPRPSYDENIRLKPYNYGGESAKQQGYRIGQPQGGYAMTPVSSRSETVEMEGAQSVGVPQQYSHTNTRSGQAF